MHLGDNTINLNFKEKCGTTYEDLDITETSGIDDISGTVVESHSLELPQTCPPLNNDHLNTSQKITYRKLCNVTSELVRTGVDNQEQSRCAFKFLILWVKKLRSNADIKPSFLEVE